jgi:site-specific recombinase XerD
MKTEDAVDSFLRQKRREGKSHWTIDGYRTSILKFRVIAPPVAEDIDRRVVERFVDSLLDEAIRPETVAHHCRGVKVFCRWLHEEEILDANPWARVKIPKVPAKMHNNLPTRDDFDRLCAACDQRTLAGRRDLAVLHFLFETGVRVSELAGLKKSDVDFDLGQARVFGKGAKERFVFFGRKTSLALTRYRMRLERGDDPPTFFVTSRAEPLTENTVRLMLKRLTLKSGVTADTNPHAFRHAFATAYLRNGGDLHSLQRLLGHASLAIVTTYLSLVTEDLSAKHRQFSPLA